MYAFINAYATKIEEIGGTVSLKKIKVDNLPIEPRIKSDLLKLPCREGGIPLKLDIGNKESEVLKIQAECEKIIKELQDKIWINDEFRQEIILAAEGVCLTNKLISAA